MQAVGHGTCENHVSQFLMYIHWSVSLGALANTLGHVQNAAAAAAAYASATRKDPKSSFAWHPYGSQRVSSTLAMGEAYNTDDANLRLPGRRNL